MKVVNDFEKILFFIKVYNICCFIPTFSLEDYVVSIIFLKIRFFNKPLVNNSLCIDIEVFVFAYIDINIGLIFIVWYYIT